MLRAKFIGGILCLSEVVIKEKHQFCIDEIFFIFLATQRPFVKFKSRAKFEHGTRFETRTSRSLAWRSTT